MGGLWWLNHAPPGMVKQERLIENSGYHESKSEEIEVINNLVCDEGLNYASATKENGKINDFLSWFFGVLFCIFYAFVFVLVLHARVFGIWGWLGSSRDFVGVLWDYC